MLKKILLTLTICAVDMLAIFQPAYAQISEFKITADDGAAGDRFGYSVSISGDYAGVGTITDASTGEYIYGTNVFLRGTTLGTVSNIEGFYSMPNLTEEEIKELKAIRLRKYKPSIIFWACVVERMRLDERRES